MTHFQEAGLVCGYLPASRRQLLLTVDLEAFTASRVELWCHAMAEWGREAAAADLRFSHFVSIEHVSRLRARHSEAYASFVSAIQPLLSGGSNIYPHNHCVFDPSTGEFPGEGTGWPQRITGYRPRASMFYDVVRRQGVNLAAWLVVVMAEYERLLRDARVPPPLTRAFRPGGWDHGSTVDEVRSYLSALTSSGYRVDSSDASGRFGHRTWQVGAPFGKNVYRLQGGLIEVAPSWSLTCGAGLASRRGLAALASLMNQPRMWLGRRPGVAVGVLHFDHLFHDWSSRSGLFEVQSAAAVTGRIKRLMTALSILQERLELEPATFDDVAPAKAMDRTPELVPAFR
jgi:hypothetical protein